MVIWIDSCSTGVNASLRDGMAQPVFKRPSLEPAEMDNFYPISNFLFLGKVVETTINLQFPRAMEKADYLDHLQQGFRLRYSAEMVCVVLIDGLWPAQDGVVYSSWLSDFLEALNTINHSIILDQYGLQRNRSVGSFEKD